MDSSSSYRVEAAPLYRMYCRLLTCVILTRAPIPTVTTAMIAARTKMLIFRVIFVISLTYNAPSLRNGVSPSRDLDKGALQRLLQPADAVNRNAVLHQ